MKRNGQVAALLLAMVMILSFLVTPIFAAGEQTFKDVPASAWYHGYVEMLYGKGIVKGYGDTGEFRPDNTLIREHAAKMIALAAGLAYQGKKADFPDVDKDGEMSPYIAALQDKGAIQGFPDGTFRPLANIQRGHAAKIIALAFGLLEGDMVSALTDLPEDADVKTAIEILESNGIVKGYGNTNLFKPEEEINRAEFSKILCIAMVVASIQNAEADPTPENIASAQALADQLPQGQDGPSQDYLQGRLDELEEDPGGGTVLPPKPEPKATLEGFFKGGEGEAITEFTVFDGQDYTDNQVQAKLSAFKNMPEGRANYRDFIEVAAQDEAFQLSVAHFKFDEGDGWQSFENDDVKGNRAYWGPADGNDQLDLSQLPVEVLSPTQGSFAINLPPGSYTLKVGIAKVVGGEYEDVFVTNGVDITVTAPVINETQNKGYETIEEAIKAAGNGETIILATGRHDLSEFRFPGGTLADDITVIGCEDALLVSPRLDRQHYGSIGQGLTFQNINFVDKYFIINSLDVKNLVIDNCTFTDGAYLQIGPVGERDGITIKDSIFEGVDSKTSILIQSNSKNIVLENNTITNAGYNGVQINKVEGHLKIDGNTIDGASNAAIRVATLEGADLTITNNTMTATNTDGKYPGEVIRISGAVTAGTLTGNTSDGKEIMFDNGIGKAVD